MAKKLTEEEQNELNMLLANNEMLEKTKKDSERRGKSTAVKQLERAQNQVIEQIKKIDPEALDTSKKTYENSSVNDILGVSSYESESSSLIDAINSSSPTSTEVAEQATDSIPMKTVVQEPTMYNTIDANAQYDVIELPSNGQCYKGKVDRVPVGYLTAYDENIITSPNLYKDGLVIDFLLKNKVLSKDINVDDLVSGDADAIILFLRATSYGPEFPITVADPQTGEQIDSVVDLTKLKPKDFKLIGDENGHFEFETPLTHDKIKFRYLTRKQEKELQKFVEMEGYGTKAFALDSERQTLISALANDKLITEGERNTIKNAVKVLENWSKKLRDQNDSNFNTMITSTMLMEITAVNGNYDREFIREFVKRMPARDSMALRKYINDNRPGIDFNITVERPQSLGGGSFETFLNWDDSVFLNISDL